MLGFDDEAEFDEMTEILESKEFVSSLAGAFSGALAAFLLNALHEVRKERDKKHEAIVRAQYTLGSQANTLVNLLKLHLERRRADPDRAHKIPSILHASTELRIDYQAIAFLANGPKPDVLGEILVAQGCYQTAQQILILRNENQERLVATSEIRGFEPDADRVQLEVAGHGKILAQRVKQLTDELYRSIDDAIPKLEHAIVALENVGKEMLFEKRFLRLRWGKPPPKPERPVV